ncbi:MAG TPA: hypothetical protein VEX70_12385 [Pyrinomonadaceae bacterium]|jgi:hypothetical protein|nr:hypothetical protein [Pyrinomonadaceae bacterium]
MFKKLFGLGRSTPRIEITRKFAELFLEYGADSLHKQYAAADYLGEHSWNFDLKTGLISFGRDRIFPFQLLGSESEYDGTWMWAWANPVSNINETLTQSSRRLREFGAANGIDEFCQPKFECKEINGSLLSMVASGVCKAPAYYRCPYDGGAAFILVDFGGTLPDESPLLLRMQTVFMEFISGFNVANQRAAFASYARLRGVGATDDGTDLLLSLGDEPVGVARFDDFNRLVHLEAEIRPSMLPS